MGGGVTGVRLGQTGKGGAAFAGRLWLTHDTDTRLRALSVRENARSPSVRTRALRPDRRTPDSPEPTGHTSAFCKQEDCKHEFYRVPRGTNLWPRARCLPRTLQLTCALSSSACSSSVYPLSNCPVVDYLPVVSHRSLFLTTQHPPYRVSSPLLFPALSPLLPRPFPPPRSQPP